MKMLKLVMAMAMVVAVLAMAHGSTSAHDDKVYHGKDFATVTADHLQGNVCDEEADGHHVRAFWFLENGQVEAAYDFSSGGNCTATDEFDAPAHRFRICEQNKGCFDEET